MYAFHSEASISTKSPGALECRVPDWTVEVDPAPCTLKSEPCTLNPAPQTPNPKPARTQARVYSMQRAVMTLALLGLASGVAVNEWCWLGCAPSRSVQGYLAKKTHPPP